MYSQKCAIARGALGLAGRSARTIMRIKKQPPPPRPRDSKLVLTEDTCPVRTLTMGFVIRVDEDVSKDTMVQMCNRLSEMFGPGHVFKPLGNKGLLNWASWPGKVEGVGSSVKEMRLLTHPRERRMEAVTWPQEVPGDVLDKWREDESLCFKKGLYKTQVLATGEARPWNKEQLDIIRGVFRLAGWRVSGIKELRGLGGYKPRDKPRKKLKDSRYVVT